MGKASKTHKRANAQSSNKRTLTPIGTVGSLPIIPKGWDVFSALVCIIALTSLGAVAIARTDVSAVVIGCVSAVAMLVALIGTNRKR